MRCGERGGLFFGSVSAKKTEATQRAAKIPAPLAQYIKTHRPLDAPGRVVGVEQRVGLGVHDVRVLGRQRALCARKHATAQPSSSSSAAHAAAAPTTLPTPSPSSCTTTTGALGPGKRPVAATPRKTVVPDAQDHLPSVDDAGTDLLARVLAALGGEERDGHEVVVPAKVAAAWGGVVGVWN